MKEFVVPKEGGNFIFRCANGSVQLAGEGSEVRQSNRIRQDTEEGEELRSVLEVETDDQFLQSDNDNKLT